MGNFTPKPAEQPVDPAGETTPPSEVTATVPAAVPETEQIPQPARPRPNVSDYL